jgi:hypothetical protein
MGEPRTRRKTWHVGTAHERVPHRQADPALGRPDAIAAAVAPPLIALALLTQGWSWPTLLAGCCLGAVVLVLARSYVELIRIIADTLLPK